MSEMPERFIQFCERLHSLGWIARNDAQWTRIRPLWDEIEAGKAEVSAMRELAERAESELEAAKAERDRAVASVHGAGKQEERG